MNLKEALLTQAPSLALQRAAADEIARLMKALEEYNWQPIETAPKDGTTILVSAGGFVYAVAWDDDADWWVVDDNKHGPYRLRGASPTQWMPAPKP